LREAQFKHYPDRFSHTLPVAGQRKNIIRVESCHTAVEHYRGGCPIPRAPSLYNGGLCISAITYIDVGFFSPHFAFFILFKQQNRRAYKRSSSFRVVAEHHCGVEFRPCDHQMTRFRAHELRPAPAKNRFNLPFYVLLGVALVYLNRLL